MAKSITPNQIRQNNRQLIYHYIYEKEQVSQQELSYELRLSRPTVTSILNELEEDGLIRKDGQIASELVGRKAAAYTIVPDYRVGIGVEITQTEVKLIAVTLKGEQIEHSVIALPYASDDAYYKKVCVEVQYFIDRLRLLARQVLGVGFAVQGLVSPDGGTVTYGQILKMTGLSIHVFARFLSCPCRFVHDATGAAAAELWVSQNLQDACYLSLSRHLGAALISRREILTGRHGHSATIEHIRIRPGGAPCYCGKTGCIETLCSMAALLRDQEEPEAFFRQVRAGDPEASGRWHTYLSDLAEVINLAHLLYDTEFILGGYLAPWLAETDLTVLYELIADMTPFAEPRDYIRISKMPEHNITVGAALLFVKEFLEGTI